MHNEAICGWLNGNLLPPLVAGVPFFPQWVPQPQHRNNRSAIATRMPQARERRLKAGWNQVLLRCDCNWGPQQVGVPIDGAANTLWQLRIRARSEDGACPADTRFKRLYK